MEPTTQTLKEQATAMLQSLITAATQAGEFIKEQMPLVLKELLLFNTAILWASVVFGIALFTVACVWLKRGIEKARVANKGLEFPYNKEGPYLLAIIPSVFGGIIGAAFFFSSISDAMKITLAPRVWLIEYAASLVK